MSELHPMFSYGADVMVLCPRCETAGGYIQRIQRPWWRKLIFSQQKRYQCQECEHKFYLSNDDDYE